MRFILKNMKREQVLAALAYGFFLACTSVTLWGGYVRFLTGQVDPGSFMLEYFVRSATLPLSLAVSGLAAFYWPKARLWRSPILALGFFLAGSLLVALQHGGVVSSEWSLVVVGACFGWGSGIMFGALQEIVAAQRCSRPVSSCLPPLGFRRCCFSLLRFCPPMQYRGCRCSCSSARRWR